MRVLMVSKFWYQRGGLERVMFDEIATLEHSGHEVVHFSTRHPDNVPSPWQSQFAPYLEIGSGKRLGAADKVRAVTRMYRNAPAARAFAGLVDATRPDVVHVHGLHRQLSPSVLLEAARRDIPVVHTLHDYHLVCPCDVMLRGGATTCLPRACGRLSFLPAVRNRCTRGSLGASAIAASELCFQRLSRAYERSVTRFICPSAFLRDLMVDGGWGRIPSDVLPPGVIASVASDAPRERFVLFAGRLSPEKGIRVFLTAAEAADMPAVVAGDGPLRDELVRDFPGVRFTGHLDASQVADLLGRALASVVPSISLENTPLGVLEAMAAGTPVIASRVGGVPELLTDGEEGLLVEPGDTDGLARAIARLAGDEGLASRLGQAGRDRARREFSPDRHLRGLLETYAKAMGDSR